MDMGAFVVVINAEKVTVSGNKYRDKIYYRHTVGRPGSLKRESFKTLQNVPSSMICTLSHQLTYPYVCSENSGAHY